MSTLELVLNMLAEAITTEISRTEQPETLRENKNIAKRGGGVAGVAREAAEAQTSKPAIASKNAADFSELVTNMDLVLENA